MPCEYSSVSFFSSWSRSIIASNSWQRCAHRRRRQQIHPADEGEILARRQVVEQGEILRHHADPAFDLAGGVGRGQVGAQNPHRAAAGRQQAGEHLDGGGFARAVGAEKTEELPRFDAQIKSVHRAHRSEAARQPARLNGKHHWFPFPWPTKLFNRPDPEWIIPTSESKCK